MGRSGRHGYANLRESRSYPATLVEFPAFYPDRLPAVLAHPASGDFGFADGADENRCIYGKDNSEKYGNESSHLVEVNHYLIALDESGRYSPTPLCINK